MQSTFFCTIGFLASLAVGGSMPDANFIPSIFPEPHLDSHNYMVAILHNDHPICGGSFIKEDTIVTAATCVYGKVNLAVAVSLANLTNDQKHQVSMVLVHPYFRKSKLDYNVAVLKIPKVDGIETLNFPKSEPPSGASLVRSSWDPNNIDGGFRLEATSLVDRDTCKKELGKYLTVTGKFMCVRNADSKLPLIHGSPVAFLDDDNNEKILYGIATYSVWKFEENLPDIYVSVANREIDSFLKMYA